MLRQWWQGAMGSVLLGVALACAGPPGGSAGAKPPSAGAAGAGAQEAMPAPAPRAPVRVVVGHLPATHSGGLYIAQERGYFLELGLEVELVPSFSSAESLLALNSGQMDVYGGATGANLYAAAARGIQVRAVADKAHSEAGVKYKAIVARKDLWDSGEIRTLADLQGRPLAGLPGGGSTEYQTEKLLQTAGLTFADIQFKPMPTPDQLVALANKSVDAVFMFQPALCTAERRNLAVVIPPLMDDIAPGLQGGVINYGERFIREKAQAARDFMVAYVRALRDYNDAQLYNVNRALIIDILQKYVNLPDLSYYDECEWGRLNPDGRIDRRWIEDEMLWSVRAGLLDRVVPVDQLVDDTYVDYALQVLGPYRPGGQ
jgi:NitT/TauT family transport system substrate-binding protein